MAELVSGAHQLHFFIPGEIAEVEDAQLAEGDEYTERAGVLGLVGRASF